MVEKKKKKSIADSIIDGTYESREIFSNDNTKKVSIADSIINGTYEKSEIFSNNKKTTTDIAPVKQEKKRTWFNSGAFSDGYQFGDVTKTILGTSTDVRQDVSKGLYKIGEGVIDTGAYLLGGGAKLIGQDEFSDSMKSFIKRDLVDENKMGEKFANDSPTGMLNNLLNGNYKALNPFNDEAKKDNTYIEKNSLLGEKSDSLVQSGGQLAGTIGLQAIGVPWWVTTGVTSFGGETEQAFQKDATYGEAGISGLVTAGAEMLTEKISSGISFGGKTLDDVVLKPFTDKIANKTVQTLTKFGLDVVGEGGEEVLSSIISKIGQKLTYEDEQTVQQMFFSKEAFDEYLESFIGGMVLSGGANSVKVASSIKNQTNYDTGLTDAEEQKAESLTNELIAEQESNGKKLTNKQKDSIKNNVMNAIKNNRNAQVEDIEQPTQEEVEQQNAQQITNENALKNENMIQNVSEIEQNIPKNEKSSQNIAENEQKTYFHGTRGDFDTFDNSKIGQNYEGDWSSLGKGFYFTNDSESARQFGESSINEGEVTVKEANLDIKKPFYVDDFTKNDNKAIENIKQKYELGDIANGYNLIDALRKKGLDSTEVLKEAGYDGIIAQDEVMVFDAGQINLKKQSTQEIEAPVKDAPVQDTNSNQQVMTEEEYLAKKGYPFMGYSESGLHMSRNTISDKVRHKDVKRVMQNAEEYDSKRAELRQEYRQKLESGEIRQPTSIEKALQTARSEFDERSDVQAARRLLEKRGIDWRTGATKEDVDKKIETQNNTEIQEAPTQETTDNGILNEKSKKALENFKKRGTKILDVVPDGWVKTENATTAPKGYSWYNNGKSMFSGEREIALVKDYNQAEVKQATNKRQTSDKQATTPTQAELDNLANIKKNKSGSEYALAFNDLQKKYGVTESYKSLNNYYSTGKALESVAPAQNVKTTTMEENPAPIRQDIAEQQRKENLNTLVNEEAPIGSGLTTNERQELETYEDFVYENGVEALDKDSKKRYEYLKQHEELNTTPEEIDSKEVTDPLQDRDMKEVGNPKVKAYQYLNPEVRPYFQKEAEIMLQELSERVEGARYPVYGADGYVDHWTGTKRALVKDLADFKDKYNLKYKDIEKGLENLIKDDGAENNAVSKRLEILINDRLRNGYTAMDGTQLPPDYNYLNFLQNKSIKEYSGQAYDDYVKSLDSLEIPSEVELKTEAPTPKEKIVTEAPIKNVEQPKTEVQEIVPPTEKVAQNRNTKPTEKQVKENKEYEKHTGVKTEKQDGGKKLTKILTDMPEDVQESRVKEYLETAGIKIIDKGLTVKNEALKYRNQTLEEDYNQIKHANREAINMAMDGYTDWTVDVTKGRKNGKLQSKKTTKSIEGMLEPIKQNNKTADFYNYMYNQLNIDRMTLESRAGEQIKQLQNEFIKYATQEKSAQEVDKKRKEIQEKINKLNKTKNKTLLNITAEESQESLKQYENETSFKTAEKDTRAYINQLQDILVDGGILSKEQKATLNEIYPHYIPAYRDVGNQVINVNSFNNNIKPNDAVGKAKGGTQDILPLDHSLMVKTKQVIQSARVNKYLKNLKDTYAKNNELKVISTEQLNESDSFEESTSTERISKTDEGKYTATVYENGKKTVFEISKGQYEALKPSDIPVITTLNTFVDIKRSLLTEYNLYFATRNFLRDLPTAFLQSQNSLKWFTNIPEAVMQVAKKGQYYQYAQSLGAGNNDYADMNNIGYADISPINTNAEHKGNKFSRGWQAVKDWKGVKWISTINGFIEQVPRMAEFITAVDSGKSGAGAIYAQDEVTVNFGKGGDITKTLDRNVTNFVNANIQGGYKMANVFRDAYAYDGGVKGVAKVLTKYALVGGSMVALMGAMWDDDEDYEELSDYIKQNYYVLGKYGDGKFIKIPKGRTNAVIEGFFNEGISVMKGEKTVKDATSDLMSVINNNLAPNSLVESSIFAGIYQTLTNTSWYGEDIVPTRLVKEEAKDQYDETTDALSIWLGQKTGLSPYKINYLLDQSTGFLGDMVLPLLTEQAETPIDNPVGETFLGQFYKDYTTDSTMKNQNITDIYALTEEGSDLYVKAKKTNAKDEDSLKYRYLTSVTASMNELYAEKRTIQNETGLTNSEKISALRDVQRQIDDLAKEGLNTYEKVTMKEAYATVGNKEYYKNVKNEWKAIDEDTAEELENLNMSKEDKNIYYKTRKEISKIVNTAKDTKEQIDIDDEGSDEYKDVVSLLSSEKKTSIVNKIINSGLDNDSKAYLYKKYYNSDSVDVATITGMDIDEYLTFTTQEFEADYNYKGKAISGSKKKKVYDYINSMNIDYEQKLILAKMQYPSENGYNHEIINYLNDDDGISFEEMRFILRKAGFNVDSEGNISW